MLREAAVGAVGVVLISAPRDLCGVRGLSIRPSSQLEHASGQFGVVLDVLGTLSLILCLKHTNTVYVETV